MIQNSTDADRLERLDGLGPENVAPKRLLMCFLVPEMYENRTDADRLECLGGLGPEIVPELAMRSFWAALGPKSQMVLKLII